MKKTTFGWFFFGSKGMDLNAYLIINFDYTRHELVGGGLYEFQTVTGCFRRVYILNGICEI